MLNKNIKILIFVYIYEKKYLNTYCLNDAPRCVCVCLNGSSLALNLSRMQRVFKPQNFDQKVHGRLPKLYTRLSSVHMSVIYHQKQIYQQTIS